MKTDLNKVKEKLVKLLNLSENGAASEGEINNALNAAAQIMAKHNLTRDDIDLDSLEPVKRVVMSRTMVTCLNSNSTTWEGMLARFCADFASNVGYYKSTGNYGINKNKKVTCYFFYGSQDETEIALDLFKELQNAISIMAVTRYESFYSLQGGAYCEGFVSALDDKYRKQKLLLKCDNQTSALIVKSDKTSALIISEAKNWLASVHKVTLRTGQGTRGASDSTGEARQLGKRDGSNYNVGNRTTTKKLN